jgi:hypothetical protein
MSDDLALDLTVLAWSLFLMTPTIVAAARSRRLRWFALANLLIG